MNVCIGAGVGACSRRRLFRSIAVSSELEAAERWSEGGREEGRVRGSLSPPHPLPVPAAGGPRAERRGAASGCPPGGAAGRHVPSAEPAGGDRVPAGPGEWAESHPAFPGTILTPLESQGSRCVPGVSSPSLRV